MAFIISRRDFLKVSSAVGLAAAINPAVAVTASGKKSKVVIATDPAAVDNPLTSKMSPNTAKIQDLVDHAIMTFTGKTNKAEAYEAIFPVKPTENTKIMIKRNDASGQGTFNTAVTNALKNGLTSMVNGKYPAANINVYMKMADGSSATKAADYIINCPVASAHVMKSGSSLDPLNYGVTLSLKNTMSYLKAPSANHPDQTHAWLWNTSLDPAIKPKQVLSLMDATVGNAKTGPGNVAGGSTSTMFATGTVIVSNDLVAVDYNTIRLMNDQKVKYQECLDQGDSDLKKAEAAGLGTCTPDNMDVFKISPPSWGLSTINGADKIMKSLNIRVLSQGNKVDFVIPGASSKHVGIFDMMGNALWQSQNFDNEYVAWNYTTKFGARVPSGMYIYRIACGSSVMRGTVMVRH
jgi:hypothetical protein